MAAPTSIIELALGAVFQPVILGILAVSSLLVGVYVLRRGLHLIVATLQGNMFMQVKFGLTKTGSVG